MSAAPAEQPKGPGVRDLDAAGLLEAIAEADRAERIATAKKVGCAYHWAILHPATEDTGIATPVGPTLHVLDRSESLGGDGTPAVAAFTPEPLAARLGITPASAAALIGDALDLVHRLPLLWKRVLRLQVPAWQARRVAQQTRQLPQSGARWVDEQLAKRVDGACGPIIVDRLVAHLTATTDPETHEEAAAQAQEAWDVRVSEPDPGLFAGTSYLTADGDTSTLREFGELVNAIAHQLGLDGDTSPLGVRKIKAIRVITRAATRRVGDDVDEVLTAVVDKQSGKIRFQVLVDVDDLEPTPPGQDVYAVGRIEKLGAATMAKLREWVGHHQVEFLPVLNMQRGDAVDVHDPPAWMCELVILRDQHCVFPGCTRDARSSDIDHIEAYDPDGPPGQTNPDNLACLCRRHHRAKTKGTWRYRRTPDGNYLWTSPQGNQYLRTPNGTHRV